MRVLFFLFRTGPLCVFMVDFLLRHFFSLYWIGRIRTLTPFFTVRAVSGVYMIPVIGHDTPDAPSARRGGDVLIFYLRGKKMPRPSF